SRYGTSGSSSACQILVGKRSCDRSSGVRVGMGAVAERCVPFPTVNVRLNFPAISRLPVRLWVNVARESPEPSRQLAYAHVADRERPGMIALDADQSALRHPVIGISRKLARRDPALPVGALELVFDDLAAVEPMLHVRAFHHYPRLVPVIVRPHHPFRRTVEREGGGCGREAAAAVGCVRVIEKLVFGCAPVDVNVLARAAIEDAAVAGLADLPLELELEIGEALLRDQVVDHAVLREHPAGDAPARGKSRFLPAAPVRGAVVVQERPPGARAGRICATGGRSRAAAPE